MSNFEIVKDLLKSTQRPGIEKVIDFLENSDFAFAPASTRYHGAYEGGLLEHSLNVYRAFKLTQMDMANVLGLEEDSIIITTLLHDICKVNFYKPEQRWRKDDNNQWEQYWTWSVDDAFPVGHGEKSVILLLKMIDLSDVEIAMIRNHMGFSQDEKMQVSHLFSKYPESILLHNADMLCTYVFESTEEDFEYLHGFLEENKENV